MATNNLRLEEYATVGDFLRVSFVRDQTEIMVRYPKLNAAFLAGFDAKLQEIKTLESSIVLTDEQKTATAQLYAEAAVLNKELNFLSSYLKEANLDSTAVSELKKDLRNGNIEGALLKIESVKQYIVAHQAELVDEGMAPNFATTLAQHKTSMAAKNGLQNAYMDSRKTLTQTNKAKYVALYAEINKIIKAGKLVYDGQNKKDEYVLSKLIARMRVTPHNGSGNNNEGGNTP